MAIRQNGDDLEDDFVLDDLVALSEDENDIQELLSVDEDAVEDPVADAEKKAKAEGDQAKKRKQRGKEKERKAKKRKLTESSNTTPHESLTAQPPPALQVYINAMQAKTFSTMSTLELEDVSIPENSIADTTIWTGPRTLDTLVEFITEALPTLRTRLSQKSKSNGAPTLLFVTGAALRVADVTRVLKDKELRGEKGGDVAKLFAKHFKLAEHVTYLKRTKVGAAVGTPGRIGKLLCETDALSIPALTHIMLDVTYQDSKKRNLLDIQETRDEVFKTVLGGEKVKEAIKAGKIQVVLF
ncbi:hypothetical protein FIBSPDRAFT_954261 [Athelia psychrophila]|uniref:U3-containing 90S pre-ribosomal complex subunit-domain containing protein n=1 Tax=Athelia psychrophila TaxID=1759441 RepID=A0A166JGC9_9AGAM|nr:hypothetical protein FIBSPDRAFT_954261 [Fibularhizoctonia sp. CBS 109695]